MAPRKVDIMKQGWYYEVFTIYHKLIYEPFDS